MMGTLQRLRKPRVVGLTGIALATVLMSVACSKSGQDAPPVVVADGVKEVALKPCLDASELGVFGTHFARKDVWEKLPSAKTLSEADGDFYLQAIEVTKSGVMGIFGWHEGAEVCVQSRNGELSARTLDGNVDKWEGPFIAINAKGGFERAYFDRIFGTPCYLAVDDEQWCFGDGTIQIGQRVLQAKMNLDTSEMPSYGFPVQVEGEPVGFWMFVRAQGAWHVFKDDFVTREGHVDIDPERSSPWRMLVPK